MSWTAPRTWTVGEIVTAAQLNAHVRDNLLETSAATVTTAGDLAYADAANSMGSRVGIGAANSLLVSTGSAPVWRTPATDSSTSSGSGTDTTFTGLSEATWSFASDIEVTVTTGTLALVLIKAKLGNDTAGAVTILSYSVSGATTTAANDSRAVAYEASVADDFATFGGFNLATVTGGSNTFTLEVRVSAGTGTIGYPEIAVIPL